MKRIPLSMKFESMVRVWFWCIWNLKGTLGCLGLKYHRGENDKNALIFYFIVWLEWTLNGIKLCVVLRYDNLKDLIMILTGLSIKLIYIGWYRTVMSK